MNHHLIGHTIGVLLCLIGAAQFIPAILDLKAESLNAKSFFLSGVFALFVGGSFVFSNLGYHKKMSVHDGFLMATLCWAAAGIFGAFPLWMSDLELSLVNSLFESISGITTTGASILTDLEKASPGLLLWRSMIQWMGGAATIVFATIFLPYLRVGGMQFFRSETSGLSSKIMPRSEDLASSLLIVYGLLTLVCALIYRLFGMNWFESINYAMTTLSTGGFALHNNSFAHFTDTPALLLAATVFMFAAALPFVLYVKWFFGGQNRFLQDEQFQALVGILTIFIAVLAFYFFWGHGYTMGESFAMASFNVVSIISTTGYWSLDYTNFGLFPVMVLFFLLYLGACAGSTSGGLKIIRLILLAKVMSAHLKGLIYSHGVFVLRYQGQTIRREIVTTVLGFVCLYVLTNTLLSVALTFTGLDLQTSMSAAASAIANVGPGIGPLIGPGGSYASLPDSAKLLLCFGMIAGRLEILTVLVLFTGRFWKN